jgi:Fibronectin type III domain
MFPLVWLWRCCVVVVWRRRRVVVVVPSPLIVFSGVILALAAPSVAAAPEAPVAGKAGSVTATTAVFEDGVLNPKAPGEPGEFEYRFRASETECMGEGEQATAAGFAAGGLKEKVAPVEVSELEPDSHYSFCLLERNLAGESNVSSVAHFVTLPEGPRVEGESASGVHGEEATLNAQVNPSNEETSVVFEYGTSEGVIGTAGAKVVSAGSLSGPGVQGASVTVTGLEQHTAYFFRVVAENEQSEKEGVPVTGQIARLVTGPLEAPEEAKAGAVGSSSVVLEGVLNPHGESEPQTYEFRYKASQSECEGGSATAEETSGTGSPLPVSAKVEGLLPDTSYTFCLHTVNAAGEEATTLAVTFRTGIAEPVVVNGSEGVVQVTAGEATVKAEINPGGAPTGYRVQYVTQTHFEESGFANPSEAPVASAPGIMVTAASTPVPEQLTLTGLASGTTYRFRFVVSNEAQQEVVGEEGEFQTPASNAPTSVELPDGRAYELASRGDPGEAYVPFGSGLESLGLFVDDFRPFRAAANGEAVTFTGAPRDLEGDGFTGEGVGNQLLSRRTSSGWEPVDVTPEIVRPSGHEVANAVYESFNDQLSLGVLASEPGQFVGTTPTSVAPKNCEALYAYSEEGGSFHALFDEEGSQPLTPGFCGTAVASGGGVPYEPHTLVFVGANAGVPGVAQDSQLLFQSSAALVTMTSEGSADDLYDSVGAGQVRLVNLLPGKVEGEGDATFGGPSQLDFSNVISADATRAFWTDLEEESGPNGGVFDEQIFMRVNPSQPQSALDGEGHCIQPALACTVAVSEGPAQYQTATPDGHYVYYLEDGGLWRYDSQAQVDGQAERTLLEPGSAEVQGVVAINQTGQDGAYVYFAAKGALTPETQPQTCEPSRGQACNLYLLHENEPIHPVATIGEDGSATESDYTSNLADRTAEATPNGDHLVFQSARAVTAYHSGEATEVYVFDAQSGHISCASCQPSGAAPVAGGALLPVSENPTFMHRWISNDGDRVFFDTNEALVPQDSDGVQDVYEWEQPGEGTCTAAQASQLAGGCTYLLSGGNDSTPSFLIDADETGDNVFFTHRGKLGPEGNEDDRNEVYDARVDGGFSRPSQACAGTGCQGTPPPPPIFTTPPSTTANGPGNLPPPLVAAKPKPKPETRAQKLAKALRVCRRDRSKRKRVACEREAKRRYGPVVKKARKNAKAKPGKKVKK